jgi:hypothetical protein
MKTFVSVMETPTFLQIYLDGLLKIVHLAQFVHISVYGPISAQGNRENYALTSLHLPFFASYY